MNSYTATDHSTYACAWCMHEGDYDTVLDHTYDHAGNPDILKVEYTVVASYSTATGDYTRTDTPATDPAAYTVQWEDGVFMSDPRPTDTHAGAVTYIRSILDAAEFPNSIHSIITETATGRQWSYWGYRVPAYANNHRDN